MADYFYERTKDGIRWNATSFLTEYSVGDDKVMDECDKYLLSWIGWEYKPFAGSLPDGTCTGCGYGFFNEDGSSNDDVRKANSRTYAMKVAGYAREMYFDKTNGNFTLIYDVNMKIVADPTVIFWNKEYWYPNGYNLVLSDNDLIGNVSDNGINYIYLYNKGDTSKDGQTLTVTLSPK